MVGVSDSPTNMGRNIVRNLIDFGYRGGIHLVGRRAGYLHGHRILTSLDEVPDGVELAVLLIPAPHVPATLEACGRKGIRMVIIETGGFGEYDASRRTVEAELSAIAGRYGMRFLGPNCLGVIAFPTGLAVPFMGFQPPDRTGRTALLAQSGGVGVYFLSAFPAANIGLERFVSMGNKLNIDEVDLLADLREHGDPDLACLYLEDVQRGRALYDEIRRCRFPVVCQKANTTSAGSRIAQSHTAAAAGDDRVLTAALRQAGAVRVRDMHSMVCLAMGLRQPPMRGNRLCVLSRSGGHAVIAADFADRFGFELPQPDARTAAELAQHFRAHVIKPINPVDLGDLFDFDVYIRILEGTLANEEIDGVVFIHTYHPAREGAQSQRLLSACGELEQRYGKPVYLSVVSEVREVERMRADHATTIYYGPEDALRALAASRDYHRRRLEMEAERPLDVPLADPAGVRAILDTARRAGRRLLTVEALELVRAAGLPVAPFGVAATIDDLERVAAEVGGPVAVKVLSEDVSHKSDVGGVVLGAKSPADAAESGRTMLRRLAEHAPTARIDGFLVQRMAPGLREVFLGARQDPSFGPVVLTGLGGIYVELFKDIAIRLAPLSLEDAEHMIDEVVSFLAFHAFRGMPSADVPFLIRAVGRMARLVMDFPEIAEIDINPMKLYREGRGGLVVDARIVLGE